MKEMVSWLPALLPAVVVALIAFFLLRISGKGSAVAIRGRVAKKRARQTSPSTSAPPSFPRWQFWRGWSDGVRKWWWRRSSRPALTADGKSVILSTNGPNGQIVAISVAEWKKATRAAHRPTRTTLFGGTFNLLCFAANIFSAYVLFPEIDGWFVLPPTLGELMVVVLIIVVSFGMTTMKSFATGMTRNWLQPYLFAVTTVSLVIAILSMVGVLHWFTPWDPKW